MSEATALIGTSATTLPLGLSQALARMQQVRVRAAASDWPSLLGALQREPPHLLLLDRQLWRAASAHRLVPIPRVRARTHVLVFCEFVDVSVVVEAIAHGVQGCLSAVATTAQWINAIRVVLRDDVAMPRKLLGQALYNALHMRTDESEPLMSEMIDRRALTNRERDVIRCVTGGMTNKEIARYLGISDTTVKTHLHHVFGKLKVGRRVLLVRDRPRFLQ